MRENKKIYELLSRGGRSFLNALFPAHCIKCCEPVDTMGSLCIKCWREIEFISAPYCAQCGYPFEYQVSEDMLCGSCLADTPPFIRGRSVLKYDDKSRDMILAFKHGDKTNQTPAFARWMARAASDIFEEEFIITPVPLHPRRLLKRRYNQSALLANSLGSLSGKKVIPDLLIRNRATPSQGGKSQKGRERNVKGAFSINPPRKNRIIGAHILLIDDVYTTGATVSACSECLLKAGVREVTVLTLCRVVRPTHISI